MPSTANRISVDRLGPNDQAAIRTLLDAFEDRGWKDRAGVAVLLVRRLAAHPDGLTTTRLAGAAPEGFLIANRTTRDAIRRVLDEFAT